MLNYVLMGFSEIDKSAIKAYCAVHDADVSDNFGDIHTLVPETLPDFDFLCGGSPCQDFSVAGTREGAVWTCDVCGYAYNPLLVHYTDRDVCPHCGYDCITFTRSSLIVNYLRVVFAKRPKVVFFENVPNLLGAANIGTFTAFVRELEEYGYVVQYKVLDARDFGLPQTRRRLYLVAVLKSVYKSWEIPDCGDVCKSVWNYIEPDVDNKYYLNELNVRKFMCGAGLDNLISSVQLKGRILADKTYTKHKERQYVNCLTARENRGLSLRCAEGTVVMERFTAQMQSRGIIPVVSQSGAAAVRRLTPLECWRLMGFQDNSTMRAMRECSDGAMYKLAGNSVAVPVLVGILRSMRRAMPEIFKDMGVFSCFSGIGAFEQALKQM